MKMRNSWRMRTTTPAVDTRPSFFAFRTFRCASVVANILREKFGPGDEARLQRKQDTYNKLSFFTVVTSEELFLAQAVVQSIVLAKYIELIAKMAVLSSKHRTDFSHKFCSTRHCLM